MQDYRRLQKKLIIVVVGLPARGKTHISYKLNRYLNWIGFHSAVFSVKSAIKVPLDFNIDLEIDPDNQERVQLRKELARVSSLMLMEFLKSGGDVAIYNALCQNQFERRQAIEQFKGMNTPYQLFWIESICNDPVVIRQNIAQSKIAGSMMSLEEFQSLLQKVESQSDAIGDDEQQSYMKIINIGHQVRLHLLDGYLQSKVVSFMLNLHITNRAVYLCRTGESIYSLEGKLGGDSDLSENGVAFAEHLANYFYDELGKLPKVRVITSTMRRGQQTTAFLTKRLQNSTPFYTKNLEEINYGECDSMTYKQLAQLYPQQIKERKNLALDFKYPRGESYVDVINRVEPVIFEIERCQSPVVVIAHSSVLKCLYAYFHVNDIKEIPTIDIPTETVIRLEPVPYAVKESRVKITYGQNQKG